MGHITVVDDDIVEEGNLHRQIIHSNDGCGASKALSACREALRLNPTVQCVPVAERLTHLNCEHVLADCDICIDACDNFETRYLLNDCCVLLGKLLVCGSAVGLEGQVTVVRPRSSACYRCLHPCLSPSESCRSCCNSGVLGPVPGLIGCLQAAEAIKILSSLQSGGGANVLIGRQVFYDGLSGEFHTFHLPGPSASCAVCGPAATISAMEDIYRPQPKPAPAHPQNECIEISPREYVDSVLLAGRRHVLLDVRSETQFSIVSLERYAEGRGAAVVPAPKVLINTPLRRLEALLAQGKEQQEQQLEEEELLLRAVGGGRDAAIYCLCRRGVDSLTAAALLRSRGYSRAVNVSGGLVAWRREVDENFPLY